MSPAVLITKTKILRSTAEGIQKAAEEAEDEAQKLVRSPEDAERELRVAEEFIACCQHLAEGLVSIWDEIRAHIRAGELGEKDLLSTERIFKRFFVSAESTFTTVRSFISYLRSRGLNPVGVANFEAAASRLAAAREGFSECYADLKDPRLQVSIKRGFEEAMRATGEPWDWRRELFGGEGK